MLRILLEVVSLMFFFSGAHGIETKAVSDGVGRSTLVDGNGKAILLLLHQYPISHAFIDRLIVGPDYTVAVYLSGEVVFEGRSMVKTKGIASHRLTLQQVNNLEKKLAEFRFGDLKAGDWSYAKLVIIVDGKVREFRADNMNMTRYVEFRDMAEEYLKTTQYRCPLSREDQRRDSYGVCKNVFEYQTKFF